MFAFVFGVVLFVGGLIASAMSGNVVFIGAIGVGLLNMLIGGAALARAARERRGID